MLISLEPIAEKHLGSVQSYVSHPHIAAGSNVPHPYPDDGALQWYGRISSGIELGLSKVFAIGCGGEFCGVMSLNGIDQINGSAELDYWIAYEMQGKGIATSAARQAIQYAAKVLNIGIIFSRCLARNAASAKVLEKLGFEEIECTEVIDGEFLGERLRLYRLNVPASNAEK